MADEILVTLDRTGAEEKLLV